MNSGIFDAGEKSDELIGEGAEEYYRERGVRAAALAKAPPEAPKRRPLTSIFAFIAAAQEQEAQREAEVKMRIEAAVEEAIKKERALTSRGPST